MEECKALLKQVDDLLDKMAALIEKMKAIGEASRTNTSA